MMDAKGGISISMIVIASIGVIVLSVVAALVIQSSGDIQGQTQCSAQGGTCLEECRTGQQNIGLSCPEDAPGQKCCRDITNS